MVGNSASQQWETQQQQMQEKHRNCKRRRSPTAAALTLAITVAALLAARGESSTRSTKHDHRSLLRQPFKGSQSNKPGPLISSTSTTQQATAAFVGVGSSSVARPAWRFSGGGGGVERSRLTGSPCVDKVESCGVRRGRIGMSAPRKPPSLPQVRLSPLMLDIRLETSRMLVFSSTPYDFLFGP